MRYTYPPYILALGSSGMVRTATPYARAWQLEKSIKNNQCVKFTLFFFDFCGYQLSVGHYWSSSL